MRPWVRRPIVTIDPSDRKMHLRKRVASACVSNTLHAVSNMDVTPLGLCLSPVMVSLGPLGVCSKMITIDPSDRKMHLRTCPASACVSNTRHDVSNSRRGVLNTRQLASECV